MARKHDTSSVCRDPRAHDLEIPRMRCDDRHLVDDEHARWPNVKSSLARRSAACRLSGTKGLQPPVPEAQAGNATGTIEFSRSRSENEAVAPGLQRPC